VRALPGVQAAGYVSFLPLTMRGGVFAIWVEGQPRDTTHSSTYAMYRIATPGYFSAMGIPLLSGRDFGEQDSLDQLRSAAVSASFARKFWPNQNPLGRRFEVAEQIRVVVGVVGDVKGRGLEADSEPQVYTPYSQIDLGYEWFQPKDLAIRTTLDPASLAPAVRRIIWSADPDQPISDVQTLPELPRDGNHSSAPPSIAAAGCLHRAGSVACRNCIYGLLSFLVSQRTPEIGVRLALGARSGGILGMFMRQGLAPRWSRVGARARRRLSCGKGMERPTLWCEADRSPGLCGGGDTLSRDYVVRMLSAGAAGFAHRSYGRGSLRVNTDGSAAALVGWVMRDGPMSSHVLPTFADCSRSLPSYADERIENARAPIPRSAERKSPYPSARNGSVSREARGIHFVSLAVEPTYRPVIP